MENNKGDFFELAFEKMEDADAFDIKDAELDRLRKENSKISEKLYKFIDQRVHPKSRKELTDIVEKRNGITSDFYARENTLYYKNGFLQGMYVIISMFYYGKNQISNE